MIQAIRSRAAGQVVDVTGASSGVDRATARAFARCGAHVALLSRGGPGLEAAAAEAKREAGCALPVPADVVDAAQVEVGSALAYRANPLQAAYCAAKHALRAFTDSLRCELMSERSGVSVTMVQLPGLNTPQSAGYACAGCPCPPGRSRRLPARGRGRGDRVGGAP